MISGAVSASSRSRRFTASGSPPTPGSWSTTPSECSASWTDGQVRDVQADMMRLTLEIVAKTLFDAEIGGETADASAAMETLDAVLSSHGPAT